MIVMYLEETLFEKGNAEVQAPPLTFEADNRNVNLAQNVNLISYQDNN